MSHALLAIFAAAATQLQPLPPPPPAAPASPHAAQAPQQATLDTTLAVTAGGRIDIESVNGQVRVRTWDRNQVRVRASHGGRGRAGVAVRSAGGVVAVSDDPTRTRGAAVSYVITVPRAFNIVVHGPMVHADVEGVRGDVDVQVALGNARVRDVQGAVRVESTTGAINIADVRGAVTARGTAQGISLARVRGPVDVEAINGPLTLRDIESGGVTARTIHGSIEYRGSIADGGRYTFSTHHGPITITVPPGSNATLAVAYVHGNFTSNVPGIEAPARAAQLPAHDGRRFQVVIGTGSARIDLESFHGNMRVVRP
jgi:hypothetical protein